ncbi:ketoacyl-ACP synthase III [Candidatus Bipolaricaulota bacterium]|nr:ketoacyl-ACP synthase III [Candidatus Bipolaricaulota bacterium]
MIEPSDNETLPNILSVGATVPEKVLTNEDLEKSLDTSDEWITSRTGIKRRHVLEKDETPSSLGVEASREALEDSPVGVEEIDLVIVATNISDMPIPGSSPLIVEELGLPSDIPFFDLKAGCSGFLYAIDVAANMIRGGGYDKILVIGLEALSRIVNWEDRSTCVLFGDGAGASVIGDRGDRGRILSTSVHGDSSKSKLIRLEGGGTRLPPAEGSEQDERYYLEMEGKGVFKSAVNMMKSSSLSVLEDADLTLSNVDWIVPHQANIRIIKQLAKSLGVGMDRIVVNLEEYANTSTATIPLAFKEGIDEGFIESGDLVLLTAFGAGAAYGATLLEW